MFLLIRCCVLLFFIMIGSWFMSGTCIVSGFFNYVPKYEISRMVVMITSLMTFIKGGLKLNKYLISKFERTL